MLIGSNEKLKGSIYHRTELQYVSMRNSDNTMLQQWQDPRIRAAEKSITHQLKVSYLIGNAPIGCFGFDLSMVHPSQQQIKMIYKDLKKFSVMKLLIGENLSAYLVFRDC